MHSPQQTFRDLHHEARPLCLANAWDAGSARLMESLGARAVATTSAGAAWALGYADGNRLPIEALVNLAAGMVRVLRVPLSVDIEAGCADAPATVAAGVARLLDVGVSGINIEDGRDAPALLAAKIERIKAMARARGSDVFVNVRTDVYLQGLVPENEQLEETVARGLRYQSAGADGFFVPALTAHAHIKVIADQVRLPLNLMAWPGQAPAGELSGLGVRRLSSGAAIPQLIWAQAERLARDFLAVGRSEPLASGCKPHGELQALFAAR
jgi:2-methylisocitrate lyase-like PEP mutase family enzyme